MSVIYANPRDFIKNIRASQRLLGLDISKKRIGLALSDSALIMAFPLTIINRGDKLSIDLKILDNIVSKENVYGLVVGLPFEKDGTFGSQGQSISDITKKIDEYLKIPIIMVDERYSTQMGRRLSTTNEDVDSIAAYWFLQIFLDKLKIIN